MQLNEPETTASDDVKRPAFLLGPALNTERSAPAPAPPALQPDSIISVLRQLFHVRTVIRFSEQEKMEAYRALCKTLSAEVQSATKPSIEAAIVALDTLLNPSGDVHCSTDSDSFLAAMERQPAFSCGLLRLVISACCDGAPFAAAVLRICRRIVHCKSSGAQSPLRGIAAKFVESRGQVVQDPAAAAAAQQHSASDANRLDLSSKHLEKQLQQLATRALKNRDSRSLVASLVNSLKCSTKNDRFVGLLVDWLELLDPELVTAQPELQVISLTNLSQTL